MRRIRLHTRMKHSLLILFVFLFTTYFSQALSLTAEQNVVIDWSYQSDKAYKNPFFDVELDFIITSPNNVTIKIPAFWNGGNQWCCRFSAAKTGEYSFRTVCSDIKTKKLHNQSGIITISNYKGNNSLYKHGALQISADKRHFEQADGTPFFWLADEWWHGMTTRLKYPEDFIQLLEDRKQKGFTVDTLGRKNHTCNLPQIPNKWWSANGLEGTVLFAGDYIGRAPVYYAFMTQSFKLVLK